MSTAAIFRHNYLRILTGLILVVLFITLPTMLLGQGYFGTVSGELTDSSGAIVQGVKVVLTDQRKGFVFNATSDSSGRYLFRAIPPGLYSVTAEMKGFEKTVRTNVKVDVNENASADMVLKVAGGAQSVDVQAEGQRLQTEDAVTGQVIDRKFINDLPLIDRAVTDLTYLAPGVGDMSDQNHAGDTGGTNFVSNGSRGASSDILSDGASVTNSEPNGGITQGTYIASPEAIEEFKVEQSNFSAEYGFTGASVVNMITRSGTNKFHGSVYDFVRDQITDANNWFNNHYGQAIAPLRRNNYGLTVGGPIIKNKTFFFVDYDAYRDTTQGVAQAGVPSIAERGGDFGEVCGAQGGTFDGTGMCSVAAGQIWDPYSGTYDSSVGGAVRSTFIPYNNVALYTSPGSPNLPSNLEPPAGPGNLIDPVSQKMMNLFPKPNIDNGIYDNWFGSGSNRGYNDQFDIKVDHRFSEKNLMSVKYSQQWSHSWGFNCFGNFTDPCQGGPNPTTAHLFTINDTETITPTLLLTTTLGFTRGAWHIDAYNPQGVNDPLGSLGFPSYLESNGFKGVPAMFIGEYQSAGYTSMGTDPYGNYRLGQDTGQLTSTLDKVHGAHELKFGFDGRLHQMNYIQTNAPLGTFNFDEHGSSQCPNDIATCGGDPMASFLMGQTGSGSYEIQFRPATENFQYGAFLQDNWKVTPKLTLNLGLRYDVTLPRTDRLNRQDFFDPSAKSPLNGGAISYTDQFNGPTTLQLHGGEVFNNSDQRTNYATDWSDIQPRFGFAYQFAPKMVVRGGFGIYYGQSRSGVTGVVPYGSQGFNEYTGMITTYQNHGATPYLHLDNPYPNGLNQPAGSSLGLLNDVGYGANGPLRNPGANQTPYEESWSFGIERELPSNIVVIAQYIGKKGTHLPFSGANQLDTLGPQIESASPAQINKLLTYVDNPFSSQNGGPISDPNSVLSSQQIQELQLQLPYPQFTGVSTDVQLIGSSIYHALQLSAEKKYSNGLQLLANFTWSKSIDDSSVADDNVTWIGSTTSLQDPNKPWLERSLSTFDIPWIVQFSYVYELPIGRGKPFLGNMPRALDAVLGGWKTSGVWRMQDGRPLQLTTADGTPLPTYGTYGYIVRPNIVGTPKRNHGADQLDNYFVDPNVFQLPPNFSLGNAPRTIGSVRGPSSFSADLSIAKQFVVREEMNFEVRLEAQNAFNHPVFGTPDTTLDDGSFGQTFYQANSPRQVQLAVKFNF
ncbi:MAG TPA: carboxypeptidase regulatory-like domain-containing protein [Terriglobales bacterium]|nr:carboxypeptidase regulatory-like domain-containing protein [Terriglobales bacterium]